MLVLTRKATETIQIGDGIVIKVIKTGRGSVKIGIEAPDNVRVMRGELCDPTTSVLLNEAEAWTPSLTSTQSAV